MNTPIDPSPVLLPRERMPAPPPPPPEAPDDSSSQALSEALRSSFLIIKILMVILVLALLGSGIVVVGPQEKAVKFRFGKPVGEGEDALLGPGLHWAFPPPIDKVVRIPVGQVLTLNSTIGWYQTSAIQEAAGAEPPPGETLNPATEGYVLTGDGNIIHVRGQVRYRISEPGLRYMFDFVSASDLVQNAFNRAIIQTSAKFKVDDILTRNYAGFREEVGRQLDAFIEKQELGVTVDQLDLTVIPPRQLKAQFDAVLETEVRRGKVLNDAKSYASQTTNRAKAEAAALINAGETDRTRLVELVAAEAKRYTDLLPAYRSSPQLFMKLHQTEVWRRVVTNAQDKYVLPQRVGGKPPELRLQLNREPQKPSTVEAPRGH